LARKGVTLTARQRPKGIPIWIPIAVSLAAVDNQTISMSGGESMRRFLAMGVIALLMIAVASPVNAGYLIIRVLLDSGSSGATTTPGTPGGPMSGGQMPRPPMGPMGSGYGPPGGFRPGMGDGPPMPMGGTPSDTAPHLTKTGDPSRSLVIVIPVEQDLTIGSPFYPGPLNQHTNPSWKPKYHITHRGLKITTNLFTDSSTVQWYESLIQSPAYRRTRVMDVHDKHARWAKTKTDSKLLFDIIVSALDIGMINDAMTYADELLAAAGEKNDGLAPEVSDFARAYGAMQKGIKGTPDKRSKADVWQAKLSATNIFASDHYALLYWDAGNAEVERRASMLEENFRAFFLSYALRGVELPIPDAPLVAVLAKRAVDVLPLARALDVPTPLVADGFYSPEYELLVLSPERLDDLGQSFMRQTQQMYNEGVSRDTLLAGKGPKIHFEGKRDENKPNEVVKKPDEVAWMQTIALVERFVDEDSALCATSREGSRQLLHATKQLPRYVILPEWLANGSVNYFTRPKDPAFVTDAKGNWMVTVAPTTGYGGPNYVLQRYFRDLLDKKELNSDRAELLKNVLTDAYFLGLRDPKEANDPDPAKEDTTGIALNSGGSTGPMGTGPIGGGPIGGGPLGGSGKPPLGGGGKPLGGVGLPGQPMGPPGSATGAFNPGMGTPVTQSEDPIAKLRKQRERLGIKAQATSWALYYYLAKDRPNELRKLMSELSVLPRDLPLDSAVVVASFSRAFALDGTKESFQKFADKWLAYMATVPAEGIDIPLVDPKPPTPSTSGNPAGGSGPPGMGKPGSGSGIPGRD
jgi:hypothetical protein